MPIIRDEHCGGIMMIPLWSQWGIRRCNMQGCRNKPSTIVTGQDAGEAGVFGLCDPHWKQLSSTPGGVDIRLEFDGFDAFTATKEADDAES